MKQPSLKKATLANFIMFLVVGLTISAWAPIVPHVKERLNLDEASLGMVLLNFGIGALMAMPIAGWLIERYGSKRLICTITPICIFILPALTIASSCWLISVLLFCFGAGTGMLNIAVNAHAVALQTLLARPLMSRFHGLLSFGSLLGAGTIGCLLTLGCSPFTGTLCLTLVLITLASTACRGLLSTVISKIEDAQEALEQPKPKVVLLGALCFVFFMTEGAMLDWSGVFLRSMHEYSESSAGFGYAAFSVAMAFGRLTGDRFVQTIGPHNILRVGSLLAAAGLAICIACTGGLELFGFFLVGLGAANVVPVLFSASGGGIALAIMTMMGYTGLLLGTLTIGYIANATSLSFAFGCGAAMLILAYFATRSLGLGTLPQTSE